MSKKEPQYLVWCDLETTGTDRKKDHILEVAVIITTQELNALAKAEWLVSLPALTLFARLDANPVVKQMHKDSGLLEALEDVEFADSISDIDKELSEMMDCVSTATNAFALAGSGVSHFDRDFIRRDMPEVEKRLQYGNLDVSVLRRTMRLVAPHLMPPAPTTPKAHRSMADTQEALDEVIAYKKILGDLSA